MYVYMYANTHYSLTTVCIHLCFYFGLYSLLLLCLVPFFCYKVEVVSLKATYVSPTPNVNQVNL
jgi:hypothetical protein